MVYQILGWPNCNRFLAENLHITFYIYTCTTVFYYYFKFTSWPNGFKILCSFPVTAQISVKTFIEPA